MTDILNNGADFLAHYGVLGMKWGIRKDEYRSLSREQKKLYRKKTLKERSSDFKKARMKNAELTVEAAARGKDNVFIQTADSPMSIPLVVSGKEFLSYLEKGGVFNATLTSVFGYTDTPEGKEVQKFVESRLDAIWEPTAQRYVLRK